MGVNVGFDNQVCGCFGGRVGAVRVKRCGFGEVSCLAKGTVDFISGYLEVFFALFIGVSFNNPGVSCGIEKGCGSKDIGYDKLF